MEKIVFHTRSDTDIEGAGWNHGKFGEGADSKYKIGEELPFRVIINNDNFNETFSSCAYHRLLDNWRKLSSKTPIQNPAVCVSERRGLNIILTIFYSSFSFQSF